MNFYSQKLKGVLPNRDILLYNCSTIINSIYYMGVIFLSSTIFQFCQLI